MNNYFGSIFDTILLLILGISTIGVQVYANIKDRKRTLDSASDQLRKDIIADYETRLKQVEGEMVQLRTDNASLTSQLQSLRDLPLKQMADSLSVIVKSQSSILETQQQIIGLIADERKALVINNNTAVPA